MTNYPITQEELRRALLERLARLAAPAGVYGAVAHGSPADVQVFGYCVQMRERLGRTRLSDPALVVVLSGTKEIWRGDVAEEMRSGVPFVIPAGVEFDTVNIPDARSGRYESICITVDARMRRALRAGSVRPAAGPVASAGSSIPLTPDLVEAYGHAAKALSDPDHASMLAHHRIFEILLLVRSAPSARALIAATLAEEVEGMIGADPARPWRVDEVARGLNLGASTLRRRLNESGASFRDLLLSARMAAAEALLVSQNYSVTQAAQASGYTSRSHFARHVLAAHGMLPSRLRRAG